MIIKMANDPKNILNFLSSYSKLVIFKSNYKNPDDPLVDATKRSATAIDGIRDLIKKRNAQSTINRIDISKMLGSDSLDLNPNITNPITDYLNTHSDVEFFDFLSEVVKIYMSHDVFNSSGGSSLLSEIESNSAQKIEPPSEETIQETTFKEEKEIRPEESRETSSNISLEQLSGWYVSSGDRFSPSIDFYGPFASNVAATLFCALIHRPGFKEESSIVTGKNLLHIFKNMNSKITDLNQAKDIHSASLINDSIAGRLKSAALNLTKGKTELDLSTSGEVFDYFTEFISRAKAFSGEDIISISDLTNWLASDEPLSFPKYYIKLKGLIGTNSDAPAEFNKIDPAIPTAESTADKKSEKDAKKEKSQSEGRPAKKTYDTSEPPVQEISSAVSSVENVSISIFSPEKPDVLSDASISAFFETIKSEAMLLKNISDNSIQNSYGSSIQKLELFFKHILDKDFEIKTELKKFRDNNKLNLSSEMSYEWEFRERFSILRKILSNQEVFDALSQVIGSFVSAGLFSEKYPEGLKLVETKVRTFIATKQIRGEEAEDLESSKQQIITDSMVEAKRVAKLEFEKKINRLINSSGLISWNTSDFINDIISDIKLNKIIGDKIEKLFFNKEKVILEQKFYMVKCGICDQLTQVPERYKNIIESFSGEIKQYSFFRKDGTLITESELIGVDSVNRYKISSEASKILSDYIALTDKLVKNRGASSINLGREYSWEEVNLMISNPQVSGSNAALQVEQNIVGLIIRNDILKNYFDAMVSGKKGIFPNKSLCAGSLLDLKEDLRSVESTKKYLEKQQDFACKAVIASSYEAPEGIRQYQASAYISPNGNMAGNKDAQSFFSPGFRFSKNEVRCPCHIDGDSDAIRIALEKKSYKDVFERIAIPNIPQNLATDLSTRFGVDPLSIYHPPTTPDGNIATNQNQTGYVVCGKKVSISKFDKDPSSPNYIRNVLYKALEKDGTKELISIVNILIDYGVEMNDLKPHVEAVMSSGLVSKSSKRKTLRELFAESKISLAQDISDISSRSVVKLSDIGLTCEHGHKFTIGQSWNFAKTHAAIIPEGRSGGQVIANPIRIKEIIEFAKASPEDAMKMLLSSPSEKMAGFGAFRISSNEEELRSNGYKQPGEAENYEDLMRLIGENKIYYKSDDGAIYVMANSSKSGAIVKNPWTPDAIKLIPRVDKVMYLKTSGMDSLTKTSEDGIVEADIADTREEYFEDDDDEDEDYFGMSKGSISDLSFAKILFPEIGSAINQIKSLPEDSAERESKNFDRAASEFITKFLRVLKLSRTWGLMAADYQLDFLKKPSSFPVQDPNIRSKIETTLVKIFDSIGVSEEKHKAFFDKFFVAYDVIGLISRSVTQDKFLSLAPIKQYYTGFSTPNIINLNEEEAIATILARLQSALSQNIPLIFGINTFDSFDSETRNRINSTIVELSQLLMSPYSGYKYSSLAENAIVDYSGRALIFSFAIDIVNKISAFYSKFFFNQESNLYIGPSYFDDRTAIDLLDELLSSTTIEGVSAPKILMMEESDFNNKFEKIKISLENGYKSEPIFINYMAAKRVLISDPDSVGNNPKDIEEAQNKLLIQFAVVCSRFSHILSMASTSIDYIISDLAAKPMGSPSIKKAAKILDVRIEGLMKERDPENFEQNKERITRSRSFYGENVDLFSTNAIGTARINLNVENSGLAPIVPELSEIKKYNINRRALVNISPDAKIDPALILLSKISVGKSDGTNRGREFYLSFVPLKTEIMDEMVKKEIDIIDHLVSDIYRVNTKQGEEFASRYLRNISNIDYSRLVVVDPDKYKSSGLYTASIKDLSSNNLSQASSEFQIKIAKINPPSLSWPPSRTLIFDPKNFKEKYNTVEDINSYYEKLFYTSSHSEFMSNIDNFETSKTSRSPEVSSSHGLIIPLKGEEDVRYMTNVSEKDALNSIKDLMSISKSEIYITSESGMRLNISWAFKTLDPQVINESGELRHRLVQSGVVQKMDYIKRKIDELYNWFNSNAATALELISKNSATAKISLSNRDSFLETFFSNLSPIVWISVDLESGISRADLIIKNIRQAFSTNSLDLSKEEFLSKSGQLVDYFNASQILNHNYANLSPSLSSAASKNLETKTSKQSLAINLLDPYSLWAIVSNPMMTNRFGGPIDPKDIEDYKSFIISTFGLREIASGIINKTGLNPVRFKEEDLFDLSGFYERYVKSFQKDQAITKFATLFGLSINEINQVESYINGLPILSGNSKEMEEIVSSAEPSELLIHPSSYIEHPWRFENSLSYLNQTELVKLRKNIAKTINTTEIESDVWNAETEDQPISLISRMRNEISSLPPGSKKKDIDAIKERYKIEVEKIVERKKEDLIASIMQKEESISNAMARNERIKNGEEVLTLNDLWSLSRGSGTTRKDSPLKGSDYYALAREATSGLRENLARLYATGAKKAMKLISWRKIAQSATDEEGNMIRSLYHKWWEQYLNVMAKLAS